MGKLKLFGITLNNPQAAYSPGEVIQGEVTVELNEDMKMRGIRLHFYGGARVLWSEGSDKHRVVYHASETYFTHELTVFGKAPGQEGDTPTLTKGLHTFPFQYQLPNNIPSSYESNTGRVRYWVKGRIDKPWKFDHTTKRAFTVNYVLDLNPCSGAEHPGQNEGSKNLCCLCCKSGPISCTFKIDRCGYVPGESIAIKGEIINNSNRIMKRSYAELYMKTQYRATAKTRTITRTATQISRGPISPGDSDTWNGERLPIPPLPPSELPGCRIIVIDYFVKLAADPAGPAFDLNVPIKVIIGTIPLKSTVQQYGVANTAAAPSSSELYTEAFAPGGTSRIPNIPPPTYAESAFGVVDIRDSDDSNHMKGTTQYTPMYTYYNWGNTATQSDPPQT